MELPGLDPPDEYGRRTGSKGRRFDVRPEGQVRRDGEDLGGPSRPWSFILKVVGNC